MGKGFYSVMQLKKTDRDEPEPVDNRREEQQEDDRASDESRAAYELRKAMESTAGGDTRKDKGRY